MSSFLWVLEVNPQAIPFFIAWGSFMMAAISSFILMVTAEAERLLRDHPIGPSVFHKSEGWVE